MVLLVLGDQEVLLGHQAHVVPVKKDNKHSNIIIYFAHTISPVTPGLPCGPFSPGKPFGPTPPAFPGSPMGPFSP